MSNCSSSQPAAIGPPARQADIHFGKLLVLAILFINGFAIALGGLSLHSSYQHHQWRAEASSQNIAQLLAERMQGDFEKIDLALLSVSDEVRGYAAGRIDRRALRAFVDRLAARVPELEGLEIAEEEPPGAAGTDSSDLAVQVSRRLSARDGSFAGVVHAHLATKHINETLAKADVGRDGSVALRNGKLALVARHPMIDSELSAIGTKIFYPEAKALMLAGGEAGTVVSRFQADQIERTVSFRKVSGHPYYVLVGLAREEYLAEWRAEAGKTVAAVALFALLTLLAGSLIHRSWRQQRTQRDVLSRQAEQISEDVLALEQAALRTRKLVQAVEQGPAIVVITDVEGTIEYVNPKFTEVTGFASAEAIGRNPRILKSGMTPAEVYSQLWATILAGRQWRGELLNRKKNGDLIWESTWISPLIGEDGQISHFIAVKEDITERKLAADELEQYRNQLERIVLQRTAELREALEAAKLADRSKDEFLANITHELRTPLAAVIGFSGLARRYAQEDRLREYLEKVNSAGKTLSGIVDDLLDLSKIVAGRMNFEAAPFSLSQVIARCRSVVSYKAEEKGLQLIESIDAAVPDLLVGDSLRLEQILLNLLSNAVKFTASGRVELRVGVCDREEHRLCLDLAVEDTGIGLSAEEIELLFKPFSQADASVTRRFGGTGLGLAICKRLAEMMEGGIEVASRVGQGTTFRVRLWLGLGRAGDSPPAPEAWREAAPLSYQDARVLVVDDQDFNRDVVEGLLAVVGITPRQAANGQEALDILAGGEAFDLVLMDIQMPVMDGVTATRMIRKLGGRFERLPIVAMTAHTMTHERERNFSGGLNDHIGKPFDEDGFYRLLAKWIPAAKQRRKAEAPPRPAAVGVPPMAGIDTRAGLALLQNDEARYRRWLGEFLTQAPAAVGEIQRALAAGEPEPASLAAHTLKGRTGLLGMTQLHAVASALEAAIDGAAPAGDLAQRLEQGVAEVCGEISRALDLGQGEGELDRVAPAAAGDAGRRM